MQQVFQRQRNCWLFQKRSHTFQFPFIFTILITSGTQCPLILTRYFFKSISGLLHKSYLYDLSIKPNMQPQRVHGHGPFCGKLLSQAEIQSSVQGVKSAIFYQTQSFLQNTACQEQQLVIAPKQVAHMNNQFTLVEYVSLPEHT